MKVISIELIMSVVSFSFTLYFWLVRMRHERPNLKFFQLYDFYLVRKAKTPEGRFTARFNQRQEKGVLVANDSVMQNSIVRFDCTLRDQGREFRGYWGYLGQDRPPWNIPPQSTISISPHCEFPVPEDFEPSREDFELVLDFVTVSGRKFRHVFRKTPQYLVHLDEETGRA